MDIATAQAAGVLAAKITVSNALLTEISNDANEGYWLVSASIQLHDKAGDTRNISVLSLSTEETAALFAAITEIFKSRLSSLNAELGSL